MLKSFANFDFAHFTGLGLGSRARGQDLRDSASPAAITASAEDEDAEDEECEDEAASSREENDGKKGGKKRGKRKGRESGEDDDEDDEDEDDDAPSEGEEDGDDDEEEEAEDSDGKRGKKAAKAAPAKTASGAFKKGRKAERRRIGLILSHPAAAKNIAFASKLACNTGMSSSAAIALLEATPAARGRGLDRDMRDARVPDVGAGSAAAPTGDSAIAASWDVATAEFRQK